jgi:PAS domain S-box-containing protein
VSESIATFVASLGDFPLDPDKGRAWLWSVDGSRLLWMSGAAWASLGHTPSSVMPEVIDSYDAAQLAALPAGAPRADATVKVETLPLINGDLTEYAICLTRHEPLRAGGYGWLAVAIGAPARSMEAVQALRDTAPPVTMLEDAASEVDASAVERPIVKAPEVLPLTQQETMSTQSVASDKKLPEAAPTAPSSLQPSVARASTFEPVSASARIQVAAPSFQAPLTVASSAQPETLAEPETLATAQTETTIAPEKPVQTSLSPKALNSSTPAWIGEDRTLVRPLRFVWQTDATGQFVHISRELAESVGTSQAMLIGLSWSDAVSRFGLQSDSDIVEGFASRDTWTAKPVMWPVAGTQIAIPVEMAGMLVTEAGQFAGFRGYGIARRELAAPFERPQVQPVSQKPQEAEPQQAELVPDEPVLEDVVADDVLEQIDATVTPSEVLINSAPIPQSIQNGAVEDEELMTQRPVAAPFVDAATSEEATQPAALPVNLEVTAEFINIMTIEAQFAPPPVLPSIPAFAPKEEPELATELKPAKEAEPASSAEGTNEALPRALPVPATSLMMTPDEVEQSLSTTERSAFRAIALALKGAEPSPKAAPMEPAPRNTDAPVPEPVIPPPTMITPLAASLPSAPLTSAPPISAPLNELEQMLSLMPIGTVIRQSGQLLYANGEALTALGAPSLEALKQNMAVARVFDESQSKDMLNDSGKAAWTVRVIGEGEQTRPFELSTHPLSLGGQPAWFGMVRAVRPPAPVGQTQTTHETAQLRQQLSELQTVVDTAADGILWLDSEARILTLNRSGEALFGFDVAEVKDQLLTTLLEPESHVAATDYIEKLKTNTVATLLNDGLEVVGRERHGGRIPLFMTASRVSSGDAPMRFCAVLKDVTIWKKAVADLSAAKKDADEANAQKTDFLAKISHEIRTPLNAILGFSQVMQSESFGPLGSDRYRQYARDINASGQHVISLVNDLLDLSKIAAGKLELSFASVDLNEVVSGCVAMIQPQANAAKVIVRSQLVPRLPNVVADERSIRQIVLNLLSNAAKFTEAGGQVIVTTAITDRGEVAIRVRDTGVGMTADEIKQAMEPFRQTAAARSRGGTGLGLPLTKALVEANRASFIIESEPKNGTMVEVTFPSTRVLAE